MSSVSMRCSSQADDARSRRSATGARTASAANRAGHCTGHATIGSGGNSVGVTVSLSSRSLATVANLANTVVRAGSQTVQMVEDAAKATADAAGEVLDNGVVAGVVGAALVSALV
jgi:hypothetical protein